MGTTKKQNTKLADMKVEDSGLTLKQEAVATELVLGHSVQAISERHDVSPSRIYEWRQMSDFAAYLKRLQRDAAREIRGQLTDMKDAALDTVKKLMAGGKDEVRLKAACYILDSLAGEVKDAKKLRAQARKLYGEKR